MPHDLNVVLVEPQIPPNTGSIGRLCLATGTTLHLVEPMGFKIDHSKLRRAGLDYWQYLQVRQHENLEAFWKAIPPDAPRIFFSKKATAPFYEHKFLPGSYLIFGSETEGLSEALLEKNSARAYCVPQYDERVRSLNLANAVSVAVYEAIRQLGY